MNKKNNLIILVALLIFSATFCPVFAESLDELLDAEKKNVPVVSETTRKLWTDLIDSLQKNDFSNAMNQADSFINTKDIVEPYQNTFTTLVLELLKGTALGSNDAEFMAKRRELIIARKRSEVLKNDLAVVQAKKARLPSRIVAGTEYHQMFLDYQRRLADNERATKDVKATISQLQQEVDSALDTKIEQIRRRTITSIMGLQTSRDYCAIEALANTYLKNVGSDSEIEKLVQDSVNLYKAQIKAIKIAKVALQPAVDSLEQGRYWEVNPEIIKAVDKINSRVTNKIELDFIKLEIDAKSNEFSRKVKAIMNERDVIFERAKQNALEGMKRLEAFHAKHQGYPDYEKDRLLIENMHTVEQIEAIKAVIPNDIDEAQKMLDQLIKSGYPADKTSILQTKISDRKKGIAAQKLSKKIATINAVIRNDPAEAKKMIKRLSEECTDPDEISVLKSELTELQRAILEREVELIRADLDEAQSYLTKTILRSTRIPGFSAEVKVGRENLVRARSLQAGTVKRLEILLNEEMDTVTKSKLVGLLEPQKVALAQMDRMLNDLDASALRSKILMALSGLLVMALGSSAFFLLRKKSNPS